MGARKFKSAKDAVVKAGLYAYRDRRQRKRMFRRLWITRINAVAGLMVSKYSELIHGFENKGINLDRKMLADLVVSDPNAFSSLVKSI